VRTAPRPKSTACRANPATPPTAAAAPTRKPLRSPAAIARYVIQTDPAFAHVVKAAGSFAPREPSGDPFNALARAIAYQQLAGRAAAAIHGRFLALFGTDLPTPATVLATPVEALRACGLSGAKATAIHDLALKFTDGTIPLDRLATLPDDEVVARLSEVRGVGRWTAEMFLLFDLRRPDVWPVDDYGVRKGWAVIHGATEMPKPKELMALGDPLRPHRSAAAWYCWRAVDTATP
jgi:DNA-3-methyladenine glycosylase II